MVSCCAVNCQNRSKKNKDLKFFAIPKGRHPFQQNRRELWLKAINRANWPDCQIKHARLCGAHFISGIFPIFQFFRIYKNNSKQITSIQRINLPD